MKKTGIICVILLLCAMLLLSGCGLMEQLSNLPKLPKLKSVSSAETETAESAQEQPDSLITPETEAPTGAVANSSSPKYGMMIHVDRTIREVYDPAEGTQRILTFAWDSVRVDSEQASEAATRITEEMAALQDAWYTGSGSAAGSYGYDAMLAAAEDNYSISREYGVTRECTATRYVTVLRSDEEVCSFRVETVTDLGGGQRSGGTETVSFSARTGERLSAVSDEPRRSVSVTGTVRLQPMEEIPDGSIEIADQVVIGDGGTALLLTVDGEVKDFSIWSVTFTDRFYPQGDLFYCGSLRNCAIQLSLLMPGDLPCTMVRYRDAAGEHEYLISMSGEDGSFSLIKNTYPKG